MNLPNIPEAIRVARRALAERWLRAGSAQARRDLIARAPKSKVVRADAGHLRPDAREIEIAALSRQVADARNQIEAANIECQAAEARISALKARREDLIRQRETLPQLVADQLEALGFLRDETL